MFLVAREPVFFRFKEEDCAGYDLSRIAVGAEVDEALNALFGGGIEGEVHRDSIAAMVGWLGVPGWVVWSWRKVLSWGLLGLRAMKDERLAFRLGWWCGFLFCPADRMGWGGVSCFATGV